MKKKVSKQNIAIIVLSVLLLVSIGFGATYSYFNGRSDTLSSGSVTTATLNVSLHNGGDDDNPASSDTAPFQLHDSTDKVVPGQPLINTALQLKNNSPTEVYAVVVYTLTYTDNKGVVHDNPIEVIPMDLQKNTVGSGWRKATYEKEDGSKIYALVHLGAKDLSGNNTTAGEGYGVLGANTATDVLGVNCLKIPETWNNDMQGATITLTFQAYIIQSTAVATQYPGIQDTDVETRKDNILSMFVAEFNLDTTTPAEPPVATE